MSGTTTGLVRVVVADDAEDLRVLVASILESDGRFTVVGQAEDGAEAVAVTTAEQPDVVLMDLSMPGVDGMEALRRLRQRTPDVRIVVLSGFRAGEFAPEALSLGASAYVEKGVELERIAQVLADVCALREDGPAIVTQSAAPVREVPDAPAGRAPVHAPEQATVPVAVPAAAATRATRRDALPALLLVTLVALTVAALTLAQSSARRQVFDAFDERARLAATLVQTDVAGLVQRAVEATAVSGRSPDELRGIANALGARNVGVADPSGVFLVSSNEALVGEDVAGRPHVAAALAGRLGVTDLFPSQTDDTPIFAVAAPLPDGEVVSTSFEPDRTPFATDLASATAQTPVVLLVDAGGTVLARAEDVAAVRVDGVDRPSEARLLGADPVVGWHTASAPVHGTSWRVVLAAPEQLLTAGLDGLLAGVPWLLIALLAAAGAVGVAGQRRSRRDAWHLAAANTELARSNEDLEQFAYVASHDLQEPLRKVASYCQLLERRYADELDAEARTYIGYAVGGARRLQQLISDLLRFSRSGQAERTHPEAVDLVAVLERAREAVSMAVDDVGGVVRLPVDAPAVHADEAQLTQVVQDLLANAVKFTDPDRPCTVDVAAAREGDEVHLTIADNGIGVPADQHERIFGVFQRLHTESEYEGTGIGLAICRRMVERNRGRIWVTSTEGHGATFHVLLPAADVEGRP